MTNLWQNPEFIIIILKCAMMLFRFIFNRSFPPCEYWVLQFTHAVGVSAATVLIIQFLSIPSLALFEKECQIFCHDGAHMSQKSWLFYFQLLISFLYVRILSIFWACDSFLRHHLQFFVIGIPVPYPRSFVRGSIDFIRQIQGKFSWNS